MKIICAWCHKKMGEKPPYKDPSVTHSICEQCAGDLVNIPADKTPIFEVRCLICEEMCDDLESVASCIKGDAHGRLQWICGECMPDEYP